MVKTKEPSVDVRQEIVNFHKLGEGYGTISKRLDIPRSTVQSIVKKFKESGTADSLPIHRRKPKLTPRLTMKISRATNMNPRSVLRDIAEYLKEPGIEIRTRTIQRTLKNGLEFHCPCKVPLLMPCHIKARLKGM